MATPAPGFKLAKILQHLFVVVDVAADPKAAELSLPGQRHSLDDIEVIGLVLQACSSQRAVFSQGCWPGAMLIPSVWLSRWSLIPDVQQAFTEVTNSRGSGGFHRGHFAQRFT